MDSTENLLSGPDFEENDGFTSNLTAANDSLIYTSLLSPAMDKTINILMIVVLFITMVSLGCTMEVTKIKDHILKPKGVAIAVLSQYGIMPLTAFCLAKGFQLPETTAVVILICGCCPGGALSNILALALKGDMNLSIVMTTCSTLLALGMMPLLLFLYCQGFSNLQKAVPYVDIIVSLVAILVPCGTGILINYFRPQYSKMITKVGLCVLMISIVVIGIISTVEIGGSLLNVLSPPLMAIAALMPLIGYAFGYIISSAFRLNQSERRTVSMETGCQNIQLCATILKVAFPPAVIGPMYLFPLVYGSMQLTEAAMLIVLFRCYQRFTRKGRETYQPASTEEKLKIAEGTA
ncbi:sodium/bile acid cotransporter [Fundulus heteroclitus]|uniref:sodium/bile acid cotransporter n=1 Tax=Fundulus heteroclitus TaxID=8078 RepID=UPI00165C45C7|nr:sodium/bile acid cotransporter [Fundulus heteroclitus]XP_036003149.1 sodium/bile acid cotransporter [Fundulus heteroclitus]